MIEVLTLVTTVLALVTAVAVLVTAVVAWRTRRRVADMGATVQEVHVMVNSQREAMVVEREVMAKRIDQLAAALQGSDTAVPPAPPGREES